MGFRRKRIKSEIYNNDIIGVVEDTNDPKRIGRIKVRLEWLHGRKGEKNSIPTEDLPWLEPSSRGATYSISTIGKVVYVSFEDGSYYKGSYFAEEHYDINLQKKLESLSADDYQNFYAIYYDANHQYYYEPNKGIVFDYKKSNINMRDNGDIRINLKENKNKLFLGTEDATQQVIMGNHFMDWMDSLVNNLLNNPYIGNLMAPVVTGPGLIGCLNQYKAIRSTFLSNHVYAVDNSKVKAQTRNFDTLQFTDNFNTESLQKVVNNISKLPEPDKREEGVTNPSNIDVPPSNVSDNMTTLINPQDATDTEKAKENIPNSTLSNGKIPIEGMTISKYLSKAFNSDTDERKYLLDMPAKNLDDFLDFYTSSKNSDWMEVSTTNGYNNYDRQVNTKKQYPLKSPNAGENPYGNANQVELYFGVDRSDSNLVDEIKKYLNYGTINNNVKQVLVLDWLKTNGVNYGWKLAGRDMNGDVQWWHWIFDSSIIPVKKESIESNSSIKSSYTFKVLQDSGDFIASIFYNGTEIGTRTYTYVSVKGNTSSEKNQQILDDLKLEADSFGFSFNGKNYDKTS